MDARDGDKGKHEKKAETGSTTQPFKCPDLNDLTDSNSIWWVVIISFFVYERRHFDTLGYTLWCPECTYFHILKYEAV